MDEEGRAADADELPVCGSMLQSNQNADGFVDLQGGKSEIPRLSRAAKLSELAPGIKLRVATANGAAAGATGSGDSTSSTSSSIGGAVASASLGAVKSASSSLLGKLSSAPTATGGARPSSLAERDGEVEDEEELDGEGAGKPEGTGPDGTRHRKKDKAGTDADGSPDHVGDDGEVDTDGGRSESSLITKRAIIQSLLEMKQKMAADVEDDREEERSDPENVTEMSRDPEQEVPVREITSEPAEEVDAATATIGTTTSGSSTTADSELRQRLVKNKVLVISPTNSDSSLDDEAARTGDNCSEAVATSRGKNALDSSSSKGSPPSSTKRRKGEIVDYELRARVLDDDSPANGESAGVDEPHETGADSAPPASPRSPSASRRPGTDTPDNAGTSSTSPVVPRDMQVVEFSDVEGFEGSSGEAPKKIGLEYAVEKVILSLLSPAIHGLKSIGIPSAQSRAEQLMLATPDHGPELDRTEACVRGIIAGSENKHTSRVLVDFFLDMVPFLGCPTILIKNTWAELRGIAVIAALYGHDVNTPRVQHEILTCLVPQGSPEEMGTPADNTSVLLTDTAGKVAKAIIKNAVERATGLRLCADVVELATLMYNLYTPASQNKIEDDSGFVHVGCTPTATARQYFRPKMLNQINHVYVPLLLMGCIANQIAQMLDLLFASSWWLILPVLGGTSGLVYYSYRRVDDIASFFRTIPGYYLTVVVFGIHALMPMFSAFASMQMVMPFCLHALDWSSSFEEFSVFLLGCANFLHLLLKKLNFAKLHPVEKFVQRWNFLLLPINPRGGTGDNSADAHRLLKRTVHCILLLRRMFLIGCGCVFAIYSVAWMEYLGGALFLGAGQRGLMLGKVVVRQRREAWQMQQARDRTSSAKRAEASRSAGEDGATDSETARRLQDEAGASPVDVQTAGATAVSAEGDDGSRTNYGFWTYVGATSGGTRDAASESVEIAQADAAAVPANAAAAAGRWGKLSSSLSLSASSWWGKEEEPNAATNAAPSSLMQEQQVVSGESHEQSENGHGAGTRATVDSPTPQQDQDQQDLNHDREDSQGQQQPHSAAASNKLSDEDREADWIVWEFLVRSRILMLAALSAWCQHHVTDVLRKREVLLKLVGAERILANSLCLLLNGIAIVSGTHITNVTLAEFLEKITPPAIVCCGIVAARSRSLLLGFALSLFPAIEARFLPLVNYGGSFITGVVISAWAFVILGKEYLKHGRSMEASHAYRLAYLVPGEVSDRTVAFLDEAVSRVRNRTMQYMAVNFLEKLFRFFLGKQA
mmetsp:Transcript_17097/g.42403  ORF Transcript_17097/g.42403 Transcript_17097/m.42403 type:complete len:1277 (-) Transcript_17097:665-4495(-)|eukprot:CAMPEP_0178999096 /NCGR_PEP_ID=MMETSP0795-20121207/9865_1 /TAXON_ID=88552 /ORGANISM="Amoebophrya sp., Strain Ameob2" /LENGTH=1276 /DNA_ID=CAMNT_0020691821 /DNA_START=390 /DNA_END=4220 /DNA_ORIENTATION=-